MNLPHSSSRPSDFFLAIAFAALSQPAIGSAQTTCFCLKHVESGTVPFFDCVEETVRSRPNNWLCRGSDGLKNEAMVVNDAFEKLFDGDGSCTPCKAELSLDGHVSVPRGVSPLPQEYISR